MAMKELTIRGIEEKIYHETLKNELSIYLVPNKDKNGVYATYTTKYGSIHNEFIPIGDTKYKKVPEGIAHFLEHKMFEQENGLDPFTFFSQNGAVANAGTGYYYTSYLFSGGDNLKDNLNYLLDYVNKPHFTDENVKKEQGIIEQEIKMYDDDPIWVLQDNLRMNMFFNHPIKYPIGGTVESIRSITKDDLYTCYNTFYHPSNMILIITGNFDIDEVMDIIKNNFKNKKFPKVKEIKRKTYNEPSKVVKEHEEKEMTVEIPKFTLGIKIPLKKLNNFEPKKRSLYLGAIGHLLFGKTTVFYENMRNKGYLNSPLSVNKIDLDEYVLAFVSGESEVPDKILKELKNELKNINIIEEELERVKKLLISSNVSLYDSIYATNNKILDNLINYGKVYDDELYIIKSLNIKELNKLIEKLDLTNISTYVITQ
jgi:predicted Zn-dependent peptidase